MTAKPDATEVKTVVAEVLAAIGTETMSQRWDAIDDLLWDHHEPYHLLPADERETWQAAFRAELDGGYEG